MLYHLNLLLLASCETPFSKSETLGTSVLVRDDEGEVVKLISMALSMVWFSKFTAGASISVLKDEKEGETIELISAAVSGLWISGWITA